MKQTEVKRFDSLYVHASPEVPHSQGRTRKTIEAYSRAVRRIQKHFDCCPDLLTVVF